MKKISQKFSLILILLILIPFVAVFFRISGLMKDALIDQNISAMKEINLGNASYIEHQLKAHETALKILSEDIENVVADENETMESLANFVGQFPDVAHVYLGSAEGKMVMYPVEELPADFDPRTRGWYTGAAEGKEAIWTDPYVDVATSKLTISAAVPVYSDDTGELKGVLGLDILLEGLSELTNKIQIGKTSTQGDTVQGGDAYILASDGTILAYKDLEMLGQPVEEGKMDYFAEAEGTFTDPKKDGDYLVSYKKFDQMDWIFVSELPFRDINVGIWQVTRDIIIFGVIAVLVSVLIGLYFSQRITKPIAQMEDVMKVVKTGDLRGDINITSKDEVGRLAQNYKEMMDKVKDLIGASLSVSQEVLRSSDDLAAFAEQTSVSANDVTRTVDEIAQGATEQAVETERGVRLSNELSEKFERLARYSLAMDENAASAKNISSEGAVVVKNLKEMSIVSKQSNQRVERAIVELDDNTTSIQGILETIQSIAAQTNLLALNASIEAARAGEVGKGFAVVADEIRKLAEGSDKAVSEINEILVKTQSDSKNTVNIMNEVKDIHDSQEQSVIKVEETFHEISKSVESIVEQIREVTGQVDQIKSDKDNIVSAMENISAISEETAAASEEVTATMAEQANAVDQVSQNAGDLSRLAGELMDQLGRFKI